MVDKLVQNKIIKYQNPDILYYFNQYIFKYLGDVACWVAGGSVREFFTEAKIEDDTDIDIFFPSIDEYNKVFNILHNDLNIETLHGCIIKVNGKKLHLIKNFFFNSPEEIIDNFDFTVCSVVIDKENIYKYCDFDSDNLNRKLVIKSYIKPLNTLKRVLKYIRKGYFISDEELILLLNQIQKLDLTKYEDEINYYTIKIREIKEIF